MEPNWYHPKKKALPMHANSDSLSSGSRSCSSELPSEQESSNRLQPSFLPSSCIPKGKPAELHAAAGGPDSDLTDRASKEKNSQDGSEKKSGHSALINPTQVDEETFCVVFAQAYRDACGQGYRLDRLDTEPEKVRASLAVINSVEGDFAMRVTYLREAADLYLADAKASPDSLTSSAGLKLWVFAQPHRLQQYLRRGIESIRAQHAKLRAQEQAAARRKADEYAHTLDPFRPKTFRDEAQWRRELEPTLRQFIKQAVSPGPGHFPDVHGLVVARIWLEEGSRHFGFPLSAAPLIGELEAAEGLRRQALSQVDKSLIDSMRKAAAQADAREQGGAA